MHSIIESIGFDLATQGDKQGWSIVDINIAHKPFKNVDTKVFKVILMTLPKMMNSMFIVGTDLDYVNSYIYSLARLLANQEEFKAIVEKHLADYTSNFVDIDGLSYADRYRQRVLGRRLYAIDLKLLSEKVSHNQQHWENAFEEMIKLGQERKYIYVAYNLHQVLAKENKDCAYQAFKIFSATRHKTNISFIAPMIWTDYARDVETGMVGAITRHWTAIALNDRLTTFAS